MSGLQRAHLMSAKCGKIDLHVCAAWKTKIVRMRIGSCFTTPLTMKTGTILIAFEKLDALNQFVECSKLL